MLAMPMMELTSPALSIRVSMSTGATSGGGAAAVVGMDATACTEDARRSLELTVRIVAAVTPVGSAWRHGLGGFSMDSWGDRRADYEGTSTPPSAYSPARQHYLAEIQSRRTRATELYRTTTGA